jgi:GNAT superfamily N-acetyltransferase
MSPEPIDVQPLAPARLADFVAFFDGDAFADNPGWRFCYCQYLHVDHRTVQWVRRTAEQNREAACQRIAAAQMQGFLAYRGGRVVGWCNAAPRTMMQAYADDHDPDDARIGQIGCFVVAKAQRRTGVAGALLRAALQGLGSSGLRIAQATPSRQARSDAQQHHGPLGMYLTAGFRVHRERDDGTMVVRRDLE